MIELKSFSARNRRQYRGMDKLEAVNGTHYMTGTSKDIFCKYDVIKSRRIEHVA